MTISSTVFTAVSRLALPAAVLLFAGCQSPTPTVAVTCPPPPSFGSSPIAAYDAYALALQPQVGTRRADHRILIASHAAAAVLGRDRLPRYALEENSRWLFSARRAPGMAAKAP